MFQVKVQGIVRNKISELNHFKGKKKVSARRFSKASLRNADNEDMFKSSLLSDETRPSEIEMTSWDEPNWMVSYRECVNLLKEVEFLEQQINKQKLKKLSSISQKKHDLIIKQFTEEASEKLNKCEKKLKQMEYSGNFNTEESHIDKKTFTNMLIAMAANIRNHVRTLRNQQQSELHRQRQLNHYTKNSVHEDIAKMKQTQNWLTEEEFDMMQMNDLQDRDVEIDKIIKSIYSLNTLYKELQNFVIEQGSLLDRIDSHIDNAVDHVHKAKDHLQSANKKQQSNCFLKTSLTLVGLIVLMLILFMVKHS